MNSIAFYANCKARMEEQKYNIFPLLEQMPRNKFPKFDN